MWAGYTGLLSVCLSVCLLHAVIYSNDRSGRNVVSDGAFLTDDGEAVYSYSTALVMTTKFRQMNLLKHTTLDQHWSQLTINLSSYLLSSTQSSQFR